MFTPIVHEMKIDFISCQTPEDHILFGRKLRNETHFIEKLRKLFPHSKCIKNTLKALYEIAGCNNASYCNKIINECYGG